MNTSMVSTSVPTSTPTCEFYVDMEGERVYCDAPGTVRIAGERDSWGTEWVHYCAGCVVAVRAEIHAAEVALRSGVCDWCKKVVTDRRWTTDPTCGCQGACCGGHVCGACRTKFWDSLYE